MSNQELIMKKLYDSVVNCEPETAAKLAQESVDAGINPVDAIKDALTPGIREVGDRFGRFEMFLPEMILAAEAMENAVKVLEPHFEGDTAKKKGKVMIASVSGDIHDLGKNIVSALLRVNGFEVFDIGRDVPNTDVIDKAEELGVDIIGLSALLTTSLPMMREIIKMMEDDGIRDNYKIIIGGGPTNQNYANEIGADGYGETAMDAVTLCDQYMGV